MRAWLTTCLVVLFAAVGFAVPITRDADKEYISRSSMPVPMCGWPMLKENSISPPQPTNVKTIQSLLNVSADGVFGPLTTEAVESFQTAHGLAADGIVGASTWQRLLPQIDSSSPSSDINATVVQFNDYYSPSAPWIPSEEWSHALASAVSGFQHGRGLSVSGVVDSDTWHYLVTDCNRPTRKSPGSGAYGFDAGWPEGLASLDSLTCLHNAGMEFAIFEAYTEGHGFWNDSVANVANAWAAGFTYVDVYHFPKRETDPVIQARELMSNLSKNKVQYGRIWIDIEGNNWLNHTQADNVAFVNKLAETFIASGNKIGIYCGRMWPQFFGSWTGMKDHPVWYAHYDQIPSTRDWMGQPYGGWTQPTIKQFYDHKTGPVADCGLEIDWDYAPQFPTE